MGRLGAWRFGVALVAAIGGCAGASASEGPPAWVGTAEALRTGVMGDEVSRGGIPREAVTDDATLAYVDATTVCFDVTVRSLASDDAPLTEVPASCRVGEVSAPAALRSVAMISVYDYNAQGSMEQTVVDHTTSEGYEHEHPRPPAEGLTRVVERSARRCCDIAATEGVDLSLGAPPRSVTLHWDLH